MERVEGDPSREHGTKPPLIVIYCNLHRDGLRRPGEL